jgi:dihydroflavonol-4-reductase
MRALVTGATGKVGSAVARALLQRGEEVVALVRDPERARELLPDRVVIAPGDVGDAPSLRRAAQGAEGVFNCMGIYEQWLRDPDGFERVNALGAANVIAAAREAGARRAVHTSTFDVFHAERGGTVSERGLADYPKGTVYERSKQRAEELVLAEAARGIEVVIVNPAGVYGPGPPAKAGLDSMFRDVIRGRLPAVPPGGMSLVHVDDVAAAHLAAFDRGVPGERYIAADGYATMRELCRTAVAAAGRGRVPPTLPLPLARALAGAGELIARGAGLRPLLARGQLEFLLWRARADATRARSELDVEFRSWEEGVRETVRWLLDESRHP